MRVIILCILVLMIGNSSAAEVKVLLSDQKLASGETFDLNVIMDPQGVSIAGAQLNLGFNQSVLNVNSVKEGNLFTQNGASTFFNSGTISNSTGTVINIFDAIIGKNNVSASGTFVIFNITVTGSQGASYLDLSNVKISDPDGLPVAFNVINGSMTINNPPALAAIENKRVFIGQSLNFTLSASDPNGDKLTFSASNIPTGASFDPVTATFRWTPNQTGTYQNLHFEVSDGLATDFENIVITVNNPAEINVSPSSQNVTSGQNFNINVNIDPRDTGIAGAQLNLAFNKSVIKINNIKEGDIFKQGSTSTLFNSGMINNSLGTVTNIYGAIIGSSNISTRGTFIIIDATAVGSSGISGIDLSSIIITDPSGDSIALRAFNGSIKINEPPIFETIANKEVNEGQLLSFTIIAQDANGDTLSYSVSNLPSGATFDPVTRKFQWIPAYNQAGNYSNIHFEVTDGTLIDSKDITIIVNNVNRAPTFTAIPVDGAIFNETDLIHIIVMANDPENDPLVYLIQIDGIQVSTLPDYSWMTNYSSSGDHIIDISVSDGNAVISKTIPVHINNAYPRYDVNENGVVDIGDITLIGQHFMEAVTAPYPRYDVNTDGVVNIIDITIACQHFGDNT